ncbi:hypothetical protein LIER_29123 [Lithospermum erythrorhizon]|uniref:Uncharacterized protein n=1 Tax=Lithospermum erythrorhizon TaxID=34254 RepID=A0AAV3RJM7_LITER
MTGERVPLFRRAKVAKKSSKEAAVPDVPGVPPTTAKAPATISGKRPAPTEARPPYSRKGKRTVRIPPHQTRFLMRVQIPLPEPKPGTQRINLPYTLPGGFQVTEISTLWKKSYAFRASRPLLLAQIGKDYKSIRDPLEVYGDLARLLIKLKELEEENAKIKVALTLAIKEKKEATSQAMVEIKKHDSLQARFTRLEDEHFDISQKLDRLQSVHNQTTKKVGELEHRVKSAEEAHPQHVQNAIFDYQRSAGFCSEAGKEAAYCLCPFNSHCSEL